MRGGRQWSRKSQQFKEQGYHSTEIWCVLSPVEFSSQTQTAHWSSDSKGFLSLCVEQRVKAITVKKAANEWKNPNYLSYSGVYMATTWRFSLITFSHYNLGHHQWKTDILTFPTAASWSVSCQFCWLLSYSGCYKAGIYSLWAKPWPLLGQLGRK